MAKKRDCGEAERAPRTSGSEAWYEHGPPFRPQFSRTPTKLRHHQRRQRRGGLNGRVLRGQGTHRGISGGPQGTEKVNSGHDYQKGTILTLCYHCLVEC